MPDIVTVDRAKKYLELVGTSHSDDLIEFMVAAAEELVLDYLKQRLGDTSAAWIAEVDAWTDETAPLRVQAAILMQTAEMFRFRGDDPPNDAPNREYGYLSHSVTRLIYRLRDPAIA